MTDRKTWPSFDTQPRGSGPALGKPWQEELCEAVADDLQAIEQWVVSEVQHQLDAKVSGVLCGSDDCIFWPHTWYANFCWQRLIPQRAARLWLRELHGRTLAAEEQLRAGGVGPRRIHKGAPYYNVGLSMFMAGDLDRALIFIGEAGEENRLTWGGDAAQLVLGNNELSERVLINPIADWMSAPAVWGDLFESATGLQLTKGELQSIIRWAAARVPDALQIIVSLHRLAAEQFFPDNAASRHLRIQALSDLVIVMESTLRRWQGVDGQLGARMQSLLTANGQARASFDRMHQNFCARYPNKVDREVTVALNWAIDECLQQFPATMARAEKVGVVCYLTLRLRNSLMHVMDDTVNLYSDQAKLLAAAGLVFSAIKISMLGEQRTLGAL